LAAEAYKVAAKAALRGAAAADENTGGRGVRTNIGGLSIGCGADGLLLTGSLVSLVVSERYFNKSSNVKLNIINVCNLIRTRKASSKQAT
jgi:hypothetical protein